VKGRPATRHYAIVKAIFCIPLFLATCALADEAVGRAAIHRTIAALNRPSQRERLFTEDADAASELARLPKARPVALPGSPDNAPRSPGPDHPSVTISHDPWGEASINFPGMPPLPPADFYPWINLLINPRIVGGAIRFITPDVALVEGGWIQQDSAGTQTIPLFFVMKKEGDNWKIASLRVLASR
jgi:hypothetical protein